MKLRVIHRLSGATFQWWPGQLFDVPSLDTILAGVPAREFVDNGTLKIVRDPDAQLELPERVPPDLERAAAPRICKSGTVICLAGGPSLTAEDVTACRNHGTVIAINDAFKLAPWADVLYAADAKWWRWHKGVPSFDGLKVSIDGVDRYYPDDAGILILANSGSLGLETSRLGLRSGRCSGYQAINLAVHLGATRIVLLGYDQQYADHGPTHWFGEHPDKSRLNVEASRPCFQTLIEPLKALGISVVNCSRQTALDVFPRASLDETFPKRTKKSKAVAA